MSFLNRIFHKAHHFTTLREKYILWKWKKYIFYFVLLTSIALFIFGMVYFDTFQFAKGGNVYFKEKLHKLFSFLSHDEFNFPGENLWVRNLKYLWVTLKYVALGNFVGFSMAFVSAYLSTSELHRRKWFSLLNKFFCGFLRAFPVLILFSFFQSGFKGSLAATLIIAWFTWLWLTRYLSELFSNLDYFKYWQSIRGGMSKFQSFRINVLGQLKNKVLLFFIYSFESNLRWTSILGKLGIIGVGWFYKNYLPDKMQFLGISLAIMLLSILILELIMLFFNKVLFESSSINFDTKVPTSFKYNWRRIIKYLFLFLMLILCISCLFDFQASSFDYDAFKIYLSDFFSFDFSKYHDDKTPFYYTLIVIFQGYTATFLGTIFAILYGYLISEKNQKSYVHLPLKVLLIAFRIIPIVVLYYLFIDLTNASGLMTFLIAFSVFRSLSRKIAESFNAINQKEITTMKRVGHSNFFVFMKFKFRAIKHDLIALMFFEFESACRDAVTFGIFMPIGMGSIYAHYQSKELYSQIIPLFLPLICFFIFLEVVSYKIRKIH